MLTRKHQKLTNENLMKTKIHNSKCDMKTVYKIKTSAYKETPYNIKTLKRSEGTIKNTKQNSRILE